jgi:predicted nucleic acid-binding protein
LILRVFLDANVLFSACYRPDGRLRLFFDLAAAGQVALVSSRFALEEARRNLAAKNPLAVPLLEEMLTQLELSREGGPAELAAASMLPAKDAPILAAALAARCALLVTGDVRHFGELFGRRIDDLRIMRPADALRAILAAENSR